MEINEHNKINKEKLFESYEEQHKTFPSKIAPLKGPQGETWNENSVITVMENQYNTQKIKELSVQGYLVWYQKTDYFDGYIVYSKVKKELRHIDLEDVQPKSIRETLHNIEKNKKI